MLKEKYRFSIQDFSPMRDGRVLPVEVICCRSSLFEAPVLFTSDLHKDCAAVLDFLDLYLQAPDWAFLALGDMAGSDEFGSNGDPTDEYKRILRSYRQFYFVDGNHDRPKERAYLLTNSDGTACCLQGNAGNVAGRVSSSEFEQRVNKCLADPDLHTFVTHDAPRLGDDFPDQRSGNDLLARFVRERSPAVHAFGHRHLESAIAGSGPTLYLNTDRRVILLEP